MFIEGKRVAEGIREWVRREVEGLRGRGVEPTLAPLLVGEDPGAKLYFRTKRRLAEKLGIRFRGVELPGDVPQEELIRTVRELGKDKDVHGLFVELPLPKHIDFSGVAQA
ncbi:bifunctional 5,10-methylene-tetrahydrofolate dehydrogenase/5,10-methylene-tetrahydrofolate cyclohydrolase, partial [Candidatus Bipolaricaulota bacterium]|nr:bifunctional 5,10-methylene-tetrahydrofolate dehydrogenase/5,10-methylene-tetrahydrofolate cyclohydrolase [Candidatus Bipolaricaulota bacterium]